MHTPGRRQSASCIPDQLQDRLEVVGRGASPTSSALLLRHCSLGHGHPSRAEAPWNARSSPRTERPLDIYNAALEQLQEAEGTKAPHSKPKSGGSSRSTSPHHRRKPSLPFVPGALIPILSGSHAPASPKTSILTQHNGLLKHLSLKEQQGSPRHSDALTPTHSQQQGNGGHRPGSSLGPNCPDSPVRRAFSAPGSQLQQIAMQHAAELAAVAAGHVPGSLKARAPSYSSLGLDVSGQVDGSAGCLSDRGMSCDTPDSPCSTSTAMSLESPHQPTASRFAAEGRPSANMLLKPRPPGGCSSSGNSSSSTPQGLQGAGGSGSFVPHPPQARKLSSKASASFGGSTPHAPSAPSVLPGLVHVRSGEASPMVESPQFHHPHGQHHWSENGALAHGVAAHGATSVPGTRLRRRSYVVSEQRAARASAMLAGFAADNLHSPSVYGTSAPGHGGGSTCGGSVVSQYGAMLLDHDHVGHGMQRTTSLPASALDVASNGMGLAPSAAYEPRCSGEQRVSERGSRPSSGRGRAVQMLVEAVRSRDEGQLAQTLEYLTAVPNGGVAGINDRHPVTGRSPLHEAVIHNSAPMVRALLAAGASPDVAHPEQGGPLLHAAGCGQLDVVSALLEAGANPEATDVMGWTALHYACSSGHVNTARLLIKKRANMSARTAQGETPLDLARADFMSALCDAENTSPTGLSASLHRQQRAAVAAAVGTAAAQQQAQQQQAHQQQAQQQRQQAQAASPDMDTNATSTPRGSSPFAQASSMGPMSTDNSTAARANAQRSRGSSSFGFVTSAGSSGFGSSPRMGGIPTTPISPALQRVASDAAAMHRPSPPERPMSTGAGLSKAFRTRRTSMSEMEAQPISAESMAEMSEEPSPRAPTPPVLTLPRHWCKPPPRGAQLSDIMAAFTDEDADLIRESREQLQQLQEQQGQARQGDINPTASHVSSLHAWAEGHESGGASSSNSGRNTATNSISNAATEELQALLPTGNSFSMPRPQLQQQQQQQQHSWQPSAAVTAQPRPYVMLPAGMPRFRFGIDPTAEPEPAAAAAAPAAAPSRLKAAIAGAAAAAFPIMFGRPAAASAPTRQARQQQQQQQQAEEDSDCVGPISFGNIVPMTAGMFAAAPALPMQMPVFPKLPEHLDTIFSEATLATAPPLLRDTSPAGSRSASPPRPEVVDMSPETSMTSRQPHRTTAHATDPTRVSRAAEALSEMVLNASAEAIGLRASAMFGKSVDLQTGNLQWTKGELLGEGAYGKVYAGLNQLTGELMAVKVLELVGRSGSPQSQAQLIALRQELDLYKQLSHKHIVGYIDSQFEARTNTLFIFLEYVPGGSIASMVERFGRFSEELVRNYTRQLLMGLEYLHGCNIVHRDLKGANILVSRDGIIKLADFGASKAYRNDAGATAVMQSMRGSVFWMAPEVIKGSGYSGRRIDIWSLGCTVIEMLTGKHPWPDHDNHLAAMMTIARSTEGPPRPSGISAQAAEFLNLCLRVEPSERPTAAELLQHPWVVAPGARRETV